jgi:hypothetical protein
MQPELPRMLYIYHSDGAAHPPVTVRPITCCIEINYTHALTNDQRTGAIRVKAVVNNHITTLSVTRGEEHQLVS